MDISRRGMLKLGAGTAALWATGAELLGAQQQPEQRPGQQKERQTEVKKKIPIALQLYSVRDDCAKDLPGVLRAVGKMGYQGVEFAGYHGRKADELCKMLDDNGLRCCGTHTGLDTLTGDALKSTAEFNATLGNQFLIVPGLPAVNTASVQALVDTAKLLTELAEKVRALDLRVGGRRDGGVVRLLHVGGGEQLLGEGPPAHAVLVRNAFEVAIQERIVALQNLTDLVEDVAHFDLSSRRRPHLQYPSECTVIGGPNQIRCHSVWQESSQCGGPGLLLVESHALRDHPLGSLQISFFLRFELAGHLL